jgi:hypothetical protein
MDTPDQKGTVELAAFKTVCLESDDTVYQTVRQNNNNQSTHKFIPTRSHPLV